MRLFYNKSEILEFQKKIALLELKNDSLIKLLRETLISGSTRFTDEGLLTMALMQLEKEDTLYEDIIEAISMLRNKPLENCEISEVITDILRAIQQLQNEENNLGMSFIINSETGHMHSWSNISESLDVDSVLCPIKFSFFHYEIYTEVLGTVHVIKAQERNIGIVMLDNAFKDML
jgi:hypothetical protein